jgi:hypothetical protein
VGVIISKSLQRIGVHSRVLSSAPHPFGFKEDFLFHRHRFRTWRVIRRRSEWKKYYDFDILHSHDALRLPENVLVRWRGKLIQHYHDPKTTSSLYPADVPSLVSLPTILKAVPNATWLPIPVDTDVFSPQKRIPHNCVRVGYCAQSLDPSKQRFIPSREIDSALNRLSRAEVLPLSDIIQHEQMTDYYGKIDVWVDRVGHGFYGFAAVEAAAMGIPVITQIGEYEKAFVPDCPFISVDRTDVAAAIVSLAEDTTLREALGERARKYAVDVHDSTKVAGRCLEFYESLMR